MMKQNNNIISWCFIQSLFSSRNGKIWSCIIFKITSEVDYTVHKALEREIHSWRQKHPVSSSLKTMEGGKVCIKTEREKKGARLWREEQWCPKASNWLSFAPAQEFFRTLEAQYHQYIHFPNQDSRFFALSLPRTSVLQRHDKFILPVTFCTVAAFMLHNAGVHNEQ